MSFNAKAEVGVRPLGGQVIPFTLVVVAALSFAAAIWMDNQGRSYVLPLAGSVVCLIVAVSLYLLSHKNSDMQKSHPFEMTMGKGATQVAITADPRSLPTVDYLKNILLYWSSLLDRQPLPEASGMVDASGKPVLDSQLEAIDITKRANEAAKSQADDFSFQLTRAVAAQNTDSPVLDE